MLKFIFDGGFMMYPITLLSIVGFAVIIDRYLAFRVAGRDVTALMRSVIAAPHTSSTRPAPILRSTLSPTSKNGTSPIAEMKNASPSTEELAPIS